MKTQIKKILDHYCFNKDDGDTNVAVDKIHALVIQAVNDQPVIQLRFDEHDRVTHRYIGKDQLIQAIENQTD